MDTVGNWKRSYPSEVGNVSFSTEREVSTIKQHGLVSIFTIIINANYQ